MKPILLIGSRDKTDFTIYVSHVITNLDKRILIVDATQKQLYRYGYTDLHFKQLLYDFHQIDILCGASDWEDVENKLRESQESVENYDLVIVDIDSYEVIQRQWVDFEEYFYIGDDLRSSQLQDVDLIKFLIDKKEDMPIRHIFFTSNYSIDADFFNQLIEPPISWHGFSHTIEFDEREVSLKVKMQHEQQIPFKKLPKEYKKVITEIVTDLYEVHIKEVKEATRTSLLKWSIPKRPSVINRKQGEVRDKWGKWL